jgi:hypothetical protein
VNVRGILPTDRPDDLPYAVWDDLLVGQVEVFNRAFARFWLTLFPFLRRGGVRRLQAQRPWKWVLR